MSKKKVKKKVVKSKKKSVKSVKPKTPAEPAPEQPKITLYPTAGPKVQEFEDLLDKKLSGDFGQQKPKRGPGRPPKEKTLEPEQPELTIDVVAGVVKIPFELWSISQSVKSLRLTDDEAQRIAEPAKQLLEHYLPQIPVIAYAWLSLSVSTFWVMQSRLRTIQDLKMHRERIQKQSSPAEPSQSGVTTKFPSEIKQEKV